MNIKTFTTTDGENALDFGSTKEKCYWCKNVGQTALYVSADANIKADGDRVALLNVGEAVMIENYDNCIYVLGAGKIEVYETENETCPFELPSVSPLDLQTAAECNALRTQVGELKTDLVDIKKTQYPKNRFNPYDFQAGFFNSDGTIAPSDTTSISGYVPVLPDSTLYVMERNSGGSYSTNIHNRCYYDSNKNFLEYAQYEGHKSVIPNNAYYVRFCYNNDARNELLITVDNADGTYTNYYRPYAKAKDNTVTVGLAGDYDFSSIRVALSFVKKYAHWKDPWEIHIYPGIYNVCEEFTDEEINSAEYVEGGFVGLEVTDGIKLVGIGDKSNVVIHGELSLSYAQDRRSAISTLNMFANSSLENLTVTSRNIRYPIHDDFGNNKNTVRNVKNCRFINYAGADGLEGQAYGLGTNSGQILNFENCYFEPNFIYHNNANFENKSIVNMYNCAIIKSLNLWDFNSGVMNELNLYSTNYGRINYDFNGNHGQNIMIYGYCNSHNMIIVPPGVIYNLDECERKKIHYGASKGKCMKMSSVHGTFETVEATNDYKSVFGILLQDTTEDDYGIVQTDGYISTNTIGIDVSTLTVGTLFTCSIDCSLITTDEPSKAIAKLVFVLDGVGYIKLIN